jgi:hypothetical protein
MQTHHSGLRNDRLPGPATPALDGMEKSSMPDMIAGKRHSLVDILKPWVRRRRAIMVVRACSKVDRGLRVR